MKSFMHLDLFNENRMGLFETESKCTIDYMLCYKTFEAKITCEQNWCIVQYIFTFS